MITDEVWRARSAADTSLQLQKFYLEHQKRSNLCDHMTEKKCSICQIVLSVMST